MIKRLMPLHCQFFSLATVTSMYLAVEGFAGVCITNTLQDSVTLKATAIPQSSPAVDTLWDSKDAITITSTKSINADDDLSTVDTMDIKQRLLDLVPRMMGTDDEYRQVEAYVNMLESRYTPVQTLPFFNMATAGEWQLLFSTNLSGMTMPRFHFRLRELVQRIDTNNFHGTICNQATWDLAEGQEQQDIGLFDASGIFTIKCNYTINQGARMVVDLEDHVLELAKGSVVPKDFQGLVGLLHRVIPKEMFDPTDHAIDTTYLDGNLRIVRMTGPRLEGVRDIFIRQGSMEINPV